MFPFCVQSFTSTVHRNTKFVGLFNFINENCYGDDSFSFNLVLKTKARN